MLITLTNDFHGTSTRVRANRCPAGLYLSSRQAKRAANILCGISGCLCGGPAGVRGQQQSSSPRELVDGSVLIERHTR